MLLNVVMKIDLDHPLIHEMHEWMMKKSGFAWPVKRPTSKKLGHQINWETANQEELIHHNFIYIPGTIVFMFKNENDKLMFILKWI